VRAEWVIAVLLVLLGVGCRSTFDTDREWLRVENEHLVIFSVAPPEETRATAEALERFRAAASALLRLRRPEGAPKLVVLIVDDAGYLDEICRGRNVAGCYASAPQGEWLTVLAGLGDELSREVVRHEYVHALVRHHTWSLPMWFEEGLAEFLSTLEVDGDDLVIGRAPNNAENAIRHHAPLRRLSTVLSRDHVDDRDSISYFQYWTLVHHWYVETPDREALNRYLERCHDGDDWIEAFEPAFGMPPDEYWKHAVMPPLADGKIRVKRLTIRRPPPDLAFTESPATSAEVLATMSRTQR
jgi:hypothetical protein